ncbi:MAG TPA: SulP family inorganic anion transporter, partial [Trueperaceae bacterium]|nr:SulP family inorganic anion transporter [Trueperaceae bacterium]
MAKDNLTKAKKRIAVGDIIAGISVALIAIPQALAYAELAGMPAHTGLNAVAFAALAAAFFASSPYIQAGPVATTSLLTFGVLSQIASPDYVAAAGLLAIIVGIVRIAIGFFKFGQIAYLLSQPVITGFISAAGILITASQIPTVFGVNVAGGILFKTFYSLTGPQLWQISSIALALATIAIVQLGKRIHPLFPSVLIAVIVGLIISKFFGYSGKTIGDISMQMPSINLDFPFQYLKKLLIGGGIIAIVGFSEAASIARTYATLERSHWDPNQEFVAQGAANIASGLFGGFPVGASFSRSSVNYSAGAKTRWSGLITGLTVLAILPFIGIFSALPKAVLAGIIIASVISLVRVSDLIKLYRYSKYQGSIALITFILTLALAPEIELAVLA